VLLYGLGSCMVFTLMVVGRLAGVYGGLDASSCRDRMAMKGFMVSTSRWSWARTCALA